MHSLLAFTHSLVHQVYNVRPLIEWGGIALIAGFLFAETGLFAGFFLPGDSLLVTAGILAKAGAFPIVKLLLWSAAAAIVGNQTGYAIGFRAGRPLFHKEDSLFFKKAHLLRAQEFYARYGAKTVVIARFMPIVRTFVPLVAGIAAMDYPRYVLYNVIGGVLWVFGLCLSGYAMAAAIPDLERRLHWVILAVIILSFVPGLIEWRRGRRAGTVS